MRGELCTTHHCGGDDEFIMARLVQRVVHIIIVDFGYLGNNRCWDACYIYHMPVLTFGSDGQGEY